MSSVDDICNFIKNCHVEYIKMTADGQLKYFFYNSNIKEKDDRIGTND